MKKEVDTTLIKHNLKLTEEQRIQNHQGALDLVCNIKEAAKKLYDKPKRTTQKNS
ncbi:MAG: hypothetical protein OXK80_03680 [Bdellovibrionales bacterium]|nr:hypothetical protein [Bdellovibrionales bacterium]